MLKGDRAATFFTILTILKPKHDSNLSEGKKVEAQVEAAIIKSGMDTIEACH